MNGGITNLLDSKLTQRRNCVYRKEMEKHVKGKS